MTFGGTPVDFFRPRRLFETLRARPSFVVPLLVLSACCLLYVEVAARRALPSVVPALLDRAAVTESELRATLQQVLRAVAVVAPLLLLPATALVAWLTLRLLRTRISFVAVLAVLSWASLWLALGFVAKAVAVLATGHVDVAMNAGAFVPAHSPVARALVALTNPFGILAMLWTMQGLRALDVPAVPSRILGSAPWVAWLAGLALLFGGPERFAPEEPVPMQNWATITHGPIALRHPPALARDGEHLATMLSTFAERLAGQLEFEPSPLRIYLYPDHATLERAAGERLHVLVTGSVRGSDLIYLELPGRSPAVPPQQGLREALRYVGIVELAPAAKGAPRWFVEGFVHAAVYPGDADLSRQFQAALRNVGIPRYEQLLEPAFFRTAEGPLLARSLVDHIAFLHGRDAPEKIMRDLIAGTSFRDALFAHTRLTTSALEAGWVEALETATGQAPSTAPDSANRLDEVVPFRKEP